MKSRLLLIGASILAFSCGNNDPKSRDTTPTYTDEDSTKKESTKMNEPMMKNGITLEKVSSPLFADATLKLEEPQEEDVVSPGDTKFAFTVENYELGSQTYDASEKMCANSAKGQHIHFILDNEPYNAFYDTVFTRDIPDGNHVLLAFVSRSYHESVKSESAYVLTKIKTDDSAEDTVDLSAPHMFYSRPKGTYSGKDTANVLLDFYLTNTKISDGGNYVTVTINGETSFDITSWEPYFIKGLNLGENTIKLELKDKDGELIESPFNPVERSITLEKGSES